ncbi:hypothetical protein AGLY_015004, partial [Aphis glycines]
MDNQVYVYPEGQWQKRGKSTSLSLCRSAESYLVSQPGFDKLNLNQKGCEKSIGILFKNGIVLQSKLYNLPKIGKNLLSNNCSPDSLLIILVCAVADSQIFFKYIASLTKIDKTAKFIINMIDRKRIGIMYKELETSTSVCSINKIDQVGTSKLYQGAVIYTSGNRTGLRVKSGNYKAYCFRPNDHWEIYDDQKEKVLPSKNKKNNVELL